MSVYDQLRNTGEVKPEFVALARRLARAVVRLHNFPPLDRHLGWTPPAFNDLLQGFFAARPIEERLAVLLAAAPNEAAFVAGLETALVRHIQSELRRTPRGSIARTVRGVIDTDPRFELRQEHLALKAWPSTLQPAQCDEAVLHQAVRSVQLVVPAWNPNSTHRAPFADRASLVRLLHTLLNSAGAPVSFNTVLAVVIRRSVVPELSREVPTDDHTSLAESPDEASPYAASRAAEVWRQLTEQQRRSVGALGAGVREAAQHIGIGKSRAAEVLAETRAQLAVMLENDPDAVDVARELLRLAAEADRLPGSGVRAAGSRDDRGGGGSL